MAPDSEVGIAAAMAVDIMEADTTAEVGTTVVVAIVAKLHNAEKRLLLQDAAFFNCTGSTDLHGTKFCNGMPCPVKRVI